MQGGMRHRMGSHNHFFVAGLECHDGIGLRNKKKKEKGCVRCHAQCTGALITEDAVSTMTREEGTAPRLNEPNLQNVRKSCPNLNHPRHSSPHHVVHGCQSAMGARRRCVCMHGLR